MKTKNRSIKPFVIAAAILLFSIVGQWSSISVSAQQYLTPVNVYQSSSTVVGWTAGTVNNGGKAVAVTAGTAAVADSQTVCTAPTFAACNIVWANSSGAVTVTAASAGVITAMADGNTVLAYVETAANGSISSIAYPQQASVANMPMTPKVFLDCGTTSTCANTITGGTKRVLFGNAALAANGVLIVSGISPAWTSSTSYGCTATLAAGTSGVTITQSTSTITFTYPGAATHTVFYHCIGS